MATLDTTKVTLPTTVTTAVASRLHDNSVIAAFSPADSLTGYHNDTYNYFTGGARAEVVGESKAKKAHDVNTKPINGKLVKVHTTTRVTDELNWADADDQLAIIEAIQADQVAAAAEALDYVILHAVNPLDGSALADYTALTKGATAVTSTGKAVDDIDAIVDALADYDVSGIGLSRKFAGDLRKARSTDGARLYPEIPLSLNAGSLEGVPAVTSSNVNGKLATTATKVLAIAGDWATIRWRIARPLTASIIAYGDPDGTGDLQRYGQVAYRTELVFSYAVLDPKRLAVLSEAPGK
jgi:hypothetical protein